MAEAAETLGTSPQTVRSLLRKGELEGEKRAWGSRYVWIVRADSLDDFLSQYGRLDGRRRSPRSPPDGPPVPPPPVTTLDTLLDTGEPVTEGPAAERPRRLPAVLRVRGRATVVVLVVGAPALAAYVYAQLIPGALWFAEVGHKDVFQRVVEEQVYVRLRAVLLVALCLTANVLVACRGSRVTQRVPGLLGVVAGSLAVGNLFGASAAGHLREYLLWRHAQPFGTVDPVHGKDVGFFVFSLPFYLQLSTWLMTLATLTLVVVLGVYRLRGAISFRPLRIDRSASWHLAVLGAMLLALVAWRLQLQRYLLLVDEPSAGQPHSFAGAGYVDVHVAAPTLTALAVLALAFAASCLVLPVVGRTRLGRVAGLLVAGSMTAVVALGGFVLAVVSPAVQRYVVDPNALLSETPYLERSLVATRTALGLDTIDVRPYEPGASFDATDFAESVSRLRRVPSWDSYVLGARMRQLVAEPPYYRPADPVPDPVATRKGRKLTAVSARELDLNQVPNEGEPWVSDRLSYTHGLGLVRYSTTDTNARGEPRLLDAGLGVEEPRLYYGDLPALASDELEVEAQVRLLTPTLDEDVADSRWVVANTRRPEVDVPATGGTRPTPYHYRGRGGIELSSSVRRAVFALTLGSTELLLSDEITPESRLLLHRDVHERLKTLAPFIQWDSEAVPLTAAGWVVYVVDGYTTSETYPYAAPVELADTRVNYARASVLATVDAFNGDVNMYMTDGAEPVLTAWSEIFPALFRPFSELPTELHGRLRYPADLFHAQATAYERYHSTRPDVFVSGADTWARPLALSGPIEVAGNVDFDESDEDDLRLTMPPVYIWIPAPGESAPRLVLRTYYTPSQGQNLVGTLSGWIDDRGRARLAALGVPREPVILGPAQVSRLVFATPRVSNLLGLRNLEIRDLDKSSIDAALLGRPHILMLEGGRVQTQSLYEGSRGPGAARLLGVTAFVNGRAGLGPDVETAVRRALNEPPAVRILPFDGPVVAGRSVEMAFVVTHARREDVTISSAGREVRARLHVSSGRGTVTWRPTERGEAHIRVSVVGLDGTRASHSRTVDVFGPPPRLRVLDRSPVAEVGKPVRIRFAVANAVDVAATISTRAGIVFNRRFDVEDGRAVVQWVPEAPGEARLALLVRGTDGQTVRKRVRLEVAPRTAVAPPTVVVTRSPRRPTVGEPAIFVVQADGCRRGRAELTGPEGDVVQTWQFGCMADRARLVWVPTRAGSFVFTAEARRDNSASQAAVSLRVRKPE